MEAANYAQYGGEPSPIVKAAIKWGVDMPDMLDMPAGIPDKYRSIAFAYKAMEGYLDAAKIQRTVDWTKLNPRHWDLVSRIIAHRKGLNGNA